MGSVSSQFNHAMIAATKYLSDLFHLFVYDKEHLERESTALKKTPCAVCRPETYSQWSFR